ncbi:hypothetical protein A8U91_03939 [Halomonas elongata]|uniref:Uncharacterized protein n=1 Tax=Halomonas elongata TaxID=2746 RepID=A0A1B8NXY7_HALEL|nr:hypothetical protein A8U91_03939 [Halomonas elongata]
MTSTRIIEIGLALCRLLVIIPTSIAVSVPIAWFWTALWYAESSGPGALLDNPDVFAMTHVTSIVIGTILGTVWWWRATR